MIVIPNQNLFRIADKNTTFMEAFKLADSVLKSGVKGVTDLMVMPGLINLDFADVRSVMSEMGKAMMGTGEAEGENRAIKAAEAAIANPLLDNVSMQGARGVLINITGGADMTLFEVDEAANRIREEVDENANIIFGSTFDSNLDGKIRVSVVATGIDVANSGSYEQTPKTVATAMKQQAEFSRPPVKNNFRDEEEDDEVTKSAFISREPVEPQSVRTSPAMQNDRFERPGRNITPPQAPAQPSGGNGLFGSLFSRKEDEVSATPPVNQQPQPQRPAVKTQEDELDIPAFMRRKGSA